MLSFLKSTEIHKFLPKEKLVDKLSLTSAQKESLKNDIKKMTITNELSPRSINIEKGEAVSGIFVMEVLLKQKDIDYKLLEALAKQNTRKILFVLRYENEGQLAVFYNKLYQSNWAEHAILSISVSGTNFDEVWEGMIREIALIKTDGIVTLYDAPIEEQLAKQEQTMWLVKEITRLEKLARNEQQPKRKFKLVGQIGEMRKKLEALNHESTEDI